MSTEAPTSTLKAIFSFPNPVNEIAARVVAGGVLLMGIATIVFDLKWLTIVMAYGFIARVLTGPSLSPLGQLATRVVVPALPIEPRPTAGPPKRFAQLIGTVFTVSVVILTFGFDQWGAAKIALGFLCVAAFLESVLAICLGCIIFAFLMRRGVIPPEVCEACNNINLRAPKPEVASNV